MVVDGDNEEGRSGRAADEKGLLFLVNEEAEGELTISLDRRTLRNRLIGGCHSNPVNRLGPICAELPLVRRGLKFLTWFYPPIIERNYILVSFANAFPAGPFAALELVCSPHPSP